MDGGQSHSAPDAWSDGPVVATDKSTSAAAGVGAGLSVLKCWNTASKFFNLFRQSAS